MDFIEKNSITALVSDSQTSHQLLWNENSGSERLTITRVHVHPGKTNARHRHDTAEQVWIALAGRGRLLLADGATKEFSAGDVVRFADGDTHGLANDSEEEFVYLSVTSPPVNFRYAYRGEAKKA